MVSLTLCLVRGDRKWSYIFPYETTYIRAYSIPLIRTFVQRMLTEHLLGDGYYAKCWEPVSARAAVARYLTLWLSQQTFTSHSYGWSVGSPRSRGQDRGCSGGL